MWSCMSKSVKRRRTDVALIVRVTRLAASCNVSPTIVPYTSQVVNVTAIYDYTPILMYWTAALEPNRLMHPV